MFWKFWVEFILVFLLVFLIFVAGHYAHAEEPQPLRYEDQTINEEAKEDSLLYYRKNPHKYPSKYDKYKTQKWESPEGWVVYYDSRDGGQCYIQHKRYDLFVNTNTVTLTVEGNHWNPRMETYAFLHRDRTVGVLFTRDITIGSSGDEFMFYAIDLRFPAVRQQYFQEYQYLQFNEHVIDLTGSKEAWRQLQNCINDK